MDVTGPLFRLRPRDNPWACAPLLWAPLDGIWAMRHQPTQCVFQVELPANLSKSLLVGPLNFGARLIQVCDGQDVPSRRQQATLARQALCVFCVANGLLTWPPDEDEFEDIPF